MDINSTGATLNEINYGYFAPIEARAQQSVQLDTPVPETATQLHSDNIDRLTKLFTDNDAASTAISHYNGFVKQLSPELSHNFARRASLALSTSDLNTVQSTLTDPLAKFARPRGVDKEEIKSQLTSSFPSDPSPSSSSPAISSSLSFQTEKAGVYTEGEIIDRLEKNRNLKFVGINPESGEISNDFEVKCDTLEDLCNLERLLTGESLSVGAPMNMFQGTAAVVQKRLRLISRLLKDGKFKAYPLLLAPFHKDVFDLLIDYNIYFPFTVVIFRPWVVMQTCTAILGTGGSGTGATLVMNRDIMLGDDVATKTHMLHMNLYNKAVVFYPERLILMDDQVIHNYLGGGTARWLTVDELIAIRNNDWKIPKNDARGSIFPVLVAYNENKHLPHILHVTGRLDPGNPEMPPDVRMQRNMYVDLLTLAPDDEHPLYPQESEHVHCTRYTFQATQFCYNPFDDRFTAVIFSNKNHMGKDVYPGMIADARSGAKIFEPQCFEDQSKYIDYFSI
jgi:hypothetical protein